MAKLEGEDEFGNIASKKPIGSVFPEHVIEASPGLARIEPFLTPKKFQERFLFGIPLVSPVTKGEITEDMLKDYITRGGSQFELEAQVDIFRVVRQYRLPFEPAARSTAPILAACPIQTVAMFGLTYCMVS